MKTITITISDELHGLYTKREDTLAPMLKVAVENEIRLQPTDRLEYVKVICRAKAPVCNWHDMELQILKGSL